MFYNTSFKITLQFFSVIFFHTSLAAVERTLQIPRRPLTVATSLKIPNLTTRPIKVLLRCSSPPKTGVYNKQVIPSDII